MKALIMIVFCCLITLQMTGQDMNPLYDSTLAKTLGADDYGMKSYVLVILKTGSNKTEDKATLDSLFAGHFENMRRLAESGKLIVAGPLGKNENLFRGIFIFNVTTIEEANELVMTDPAVNEKLFDADIYPWYGSAALPEYLKTHERIEKYKIQ